MRPRIWHHVMTALGLMILLAATLFAVIRWHAIPEQVPMHFDASGQASGYGSKSTIIFLLIAAWVTYVVITVVSFFPNAWNMPGRNRPNGLRAAADMMAVMRPILAFLFGWLIFCSAQGRGLGAWFLPVTMGALLGNVLMGIARAMR